MGDFQTAISNLEFRKLGCNWGTGNPSFYNVLKNHSIVIRADYDREFLKGDLILIAEGYWILAIAQIISNPKEVSSNSRLENELNSHNVSNTYEVFYYDVEFFELPKHDIFEYKLQQGIRNVNKKHIKENVFRLWTSRHEKTKDDNRLFRLTWNTNNWELPSGHKWDESKQGNTNVAYENQHGFGHEEWLFNPRYRSGEYQYGYIRGIQKMSIEAEIIDKAVLFSIDPNSKQRYLIAELVDVEIIEDYDIELNKAEKLFAKYDQDNETELKEVEANYKVLRTDPIRPNIKFKWSGAEIYNDPIPVSFLGDSKYNRFQPYKIEGDLDDLLNSESENKSTFNYQSGKASTTPSYSKNVKGGKKSVQRNHSNITDDLYDFLHKVEGYSKEQLSAERTRIGGAIVDFVIDEKVGYRLFEAKTSSTGLQNIRLAIGQLLEYAFTDEQANIKELIIVGPAQLKETEITYFDRLKEVIKIPLAYWAYNPNERLLKNKFTKE